LTASNRKITDPLPAVGSDVKRARVPTQTTANARPVGAEAGKAASAIRTVRSPPGRGPSDEAKVTRPTGYAEHGERTVRVQAVCREPPDLDGFVATLLALALAEMGEERTHAKTSDVR
jgi:hypothetical protein